MGRKFFIIVSTVCSIVVLLVLILFLLKETKDNSSDLNSELNSLVPIEQVVKEFEICVDGAKYPNLVIHDFKTSLIDIKSMYNIKILTNREYKERTLLQEFTRMNKAIEKFFMEDFDKSYIELLFLGPEEISPICYEDIETKCADGQYDSIENAVLFGNNTGNDGYMVQVGRGESMAWFSKNGFGTIQPSLNEPEYVYSYINGIRQSEDEYIAFKDGLCKLSEFETNVISYMNNKFPLEVSDDITFGIGEIRLIDLGDYKGACVKTRRIYKGIPFEYGNTSAVGQYIDKYKHEKGELDFVESMYPDTLLGFGNVNGKVVETDTIEKILPIDDALNILSDKIGDNSIYDVYGIELVYRECYTSEEIKVFEQSENEDIMSILKPMWKIISINQNDDKYTLFYIDVVTGDVTERFEYRYE